MKTLTLFLSGALFAVGLVISGMTNTNTVLNFLDITGSWDPSLLFVMIGAISVHSISYAFSKTRAQPLLEKQWTIPNHKTIDAPLILGAALFGMGWGLAGICPGPAIVAFVGLSSLPILVFFVSMIAGILCFRMTKNVFHIK